jgi:DNA-binding MarR family transcriptional regulator
MVHGTTYYPCVPEVSMNDRLVTEIAADLHTTFSRMPRETPPSLVRDLTLGQIRLLFLLSREGPQPMGRIGEVFDLSSTASTGFVERIERHGMVTRRHRSDDRRVVECALTDAGKQFLDELTGIRLDVTRRALSALDPTDLAEFGRLLRMIRARQERTEAHA